MFDSRKAKKEVASYKKGAVLSDIFIGHNAFYDVPWAIEKWGNFYIHNHVLSACFHAEDHVKIPAGVKALDDVEKVLDKIEEVTETGKLSELTSWLS